MKGWMWVLLFVMVLGGCSYEKSSDSVQRDQQERILKEATAQSGLPAITNFRERKLAKQILEMRDQEGLVTYTYLWSDMLGQAIFLCHSVGYGLPYATQYTNPQKVETYTSGRLTLPQADPNGLFSPASADASWVVCKVPGVGKAVPGYFEPRVMTVPYKLPCTVVKDGAVDKRYCSEDEGAPVPAPTKVYANVSGNDAPVPTLTKVYANVPVNDVPAPALKAPAAPEKGAVTPPNLAPAVPVVPTGKVQTDAPAVPEGKPPVVIPPGGSTLYNVVF